MADLSKNPIKNEDDFHDTTSECVKKNDENKSELSSTNTTSRKFELSPENMKSSDSESLTKNLKSASSELSKTEVKSQNMETENKSPELSSGNTLTADQAASAKSVGSGSSDSDENLEGGKLSVTEKRKSSQSSDETIEYSPKSFERDQRIESTASSGESVESMKIDEDSPSESVFFHATRNKNLETVEPMSTSEDSSSNSDSGEAKEVSSKTDSTVKGKSKEETSSHVSAKIQFLASENTSANQTQSKPQEESEIEHMDRPSVSFSLNDNNDDSCISQPERVLGIDSTDGGGKDSHQTENDGTDEQVNVASKSVNYTTNNPEQVNITNVTEQSSQTDARLNPYNNSILFALLVGTQAGYLYMQQDMQNEANEMQVHLGREPSASGIQRSDEEIMQELEHAYEDDRTLEPTVESLHAQNCAEGSFSRNTTIKEMVSTYLFDNGYYDPRSCGYFGEKEPVPVVKRKILMTHIAYETPKGGARPVRVNSQIRRPSSIAFAFESPKGTTPYVTYYYRQGGRFMQVAIAHAFSQESMKQFDELKQSEYSSRFAQQQEYSSRKVDKSLPESSTNEDQAGATTSGEVYIPKTSECQGDGINIPREDVSPQVKTKGRSVFTELQRMSSRKAQNDVIMFQAQGNFKIVNPSGAYAVFESQSYVREIKPQNDDSNVQYQGSSVSTHSQTDTPMFQSHDVSNIQYEGNITLTRIPPNVQAFSAANNFESQDVSELLRHQREIPNFNFPGERPKSRMSIPKFKAPTSLPKSKRVSPYVHPHDSSNSPSPKSTKMSKSQEDASFQPEMFQGPHCSTFTLEKSKTLRMLNKLNIQPVAASSISAIEGPLNIFGYHISNEIPSVECDYSTSSGQQAADFHRQNDNRNIPSKDIVTNLVYADNAPGISQTILPYYTLRELNQIFPNQHQDENLDENKELCRKLENTEEELRSMDNFTRIMLPNHVSVRLEPYKAELEVGTDPQTWQFCVWNETTVEDFQKYLANEGYMPTDSCIWFVDDYMVRSELTMRALLRKYNRENILYMRYCRYDIYYEALETNVELPEH